MDPLSTLTPAFTEFGFPAALVIVMIGVIWKMFQAHSLERVQAAKLHATERKEWRESALSLEKARDERAMRRDDKMLATLEQLTDAVRNNH